jgi:hypothetical protein
LKILAEISGFLEKLLKMRLAVQDSIHGRVGAHLSIMGWLLPLRLFDSLLLQENAKINFVAYITERFFKIVYKFVIGLYNTI